MFSFDLCILKMPHALVWFHFFKFQLIQAQQATHIKIELTAEGKSIAQNGSYEANVFKALGASGTAQAEVMVYF